MRFLNDFSCLLGEAFLLFSIIIFIFLVLLTKVDFKFKGSVKQPLLFSSGTVLSQVILVITFILLVLSPEEYSILSNTFVGSPLIKFLKIIVVILVFFLSFIFKDYGRYEKQQMFEVQALVLISLSALLLLLSADDLILFYIVLEMQSLSTYVLAASRRENVLSAEAGLKYFVLGALASGFFLFGTAIAYGILGTTSLTEISFLVVGQASLGGLLTASIFIVSAIAFKLAVAPFHAWSPDVYEGAPLQ